MDTLAIFKTSNCMISEGINICGNIVGMGIMMGKVEIDARGRLTIPAEIREKMNIRPGDKLSIKIGPENEIKIQKSPSKEEIFNKLVGCIKIPSDHSPSVEEIKGIWKIKP